MYRGYSVFLEVTAILTLNVTRVHGHFFKTKINVYIFHSIWPSVPTVADT